MLGTSRMNFTLLLFGMSFGLCPLIIVCLRSYFFILRVVRWVHSQPALLFSISVLVRNAVALIYFILLSLGHLADQVTPPFSEPCGDIFKVLLVILCSIQIRNVSAPAKENPYPSLSEVLSASLSNVYNQQYQHHNSDKSSSDKASDPLFEVLLEDFARGFGLLYSKN